MVSRRDGSSCTQDEASASALARGSESAPGEETQPDRSGDFESAPGHDRARMPTGINRNILRLAIPSLGALIAPPLFMIVDSAFVARVSTTSLAGLGIASTVLSTVVGLSVFLAYSTTAAVSREFGAGNQRNAVARGVDAAWLGLGIGVVCAVALIVTAPGLLALFGSEPEVTSEAVVYMRLAALGLPAVLIIQATTGLVRGMQQAWLPLVVAVGGVAIAIPLNYLLIFTMGWGIAGSAIGTALCEILMALVFVAAVVKYARTHEVSLRPQLAAIRASGRDGFPTFVRTLALRLVAILTVVAAARLGSAQLAAHQLAITIFTLLSMALDSLAIAGQALTGRFLGARDVRSVRAVIDRLVMWGAAGGFAAGVLTLAASYVMPGVFSPDPEVQVNLQAALWVLALAQPIAGYVFTIDGILLGAGDTPYLAKASMVAAALVIPGVIAVAVFTPAGAWGVALLWIVTNLLHLVARGVTLWWRMRSDAWMRL